ncbi:MAG: hypothetical protein QM767_19695 [Anaeromyxobacter sp.]
MPTFQRDLVAFALALARPEKPQPSDQLLAAYDEELRARYDDRGQLSGRLAAQGIVPTIEARSGFVLFAEIFGQGAAPSQAKARALAWLKKVVETGGLGAVAAPGAMLLRRTVKGGKGGGKRKGATRRSASRGGRK